MFLNRIVNPVFLRGNGFLGGFARTVTSGTGFGNPEMPDKLYKSITLEIRGAEPAVMRSYTTFIENAASHLDVDVEKVVRKRKPSFNRISLLKSVFVHRKHLVQYEVRTHYIWIYLKHLTGSTADTFLEYVERMLPESVALKVTKVEVEPLPSHLNPSVMQKEANSKSQLDKSLKRKVTKPSSKDFSE